jgi:hypothetical protein
MNRLSPAIARNGLRLVLALGLAASLATPPSRANAPVARYTLTAETVYDTQTTLTWQRADDGTTRTWEAAADYCASLSLDGGGWRLPAVKELLSLLDVSRSNPALDAAAFPQATNGTYWSGSDQAGVAGGKWTVYFVYGNLSWTGATDHNVVRCVR